MSNRECAATDVVTPPRNECFSPHDTAQTPAISRIGSTVHTPHLQRCRLEPTAVSAEEDDGAMEEHLIVHFEEEQVRLETCGLLGKGGFGKVFAAQSSSGNLYALKVSSKPMRDSDWRRLNEEITLMRHFSRHPNIVKLYFAGRDEKRAYVVMERCAGRSLHDLVAQRNLDVSEILWTGWALVNTVAYIHSKGCIHRDLKPQNLLFDVEGNLKITDFGLSSRISEAQPRKTVAGTAMYMAPEMAEEVYKRMLKRNNSSSGSNTKDNDHAAEDRLGPSLSYGKEVDTWSIGVVLYVLLTRMNPYIDAMEKSATRHADKEQKSLVLFDAVAGAAWGWPRRWSGDLQLCRLVERILHPDRNQRATLQEVQEDTIWHRRPLSCPISLLQKLNLLEESGFSHGHPHPQRDAPQQTQQRHGGAHPHIHAYATHRHSPTPYALQHAAENIPTMSGKRTVEQVMREAVHTLETAEQRGRVRLWLACQETFTVLATLLALGRGETEERRRIVIDEAHTRAVHERRMRSTCYEILTRYSHNNASYKNQSDSNSGNAKDAHSIRAAMADPLTSPHDRRKECNASRAVSVSLLSQSATDEEEERSSSNHTRSKERRSHRRKSSSQATSHRRPNRSSSRAGHTRLMYQTSPHPATLTTTATRTTFARELSQNSSSTTSTETTLVRSSPDQFALVYPGRDVATRWSLRPVVSLPRELTGTIERQLRCMNGHFMTKLTMMPHAYNGFDCNVCDRGIEVITIKQPAFRCYKCDYDVCMQCGYEGRCKEVNFVCVSCGKKFVSSAKLRAHSLRCRGPSESPSPRRSSRMNTMLWESGSQSPWSSDNPVQPDKPPASPLSEQQGGQHHKKPSEAPLYARQSGTGRPTYTRTSAGTHISVDDSRISSPEDVGALLMSHRTAEFLELAGSDDSASSSHGSERKKPASAATAAQRERQRYEDADVQESGSFSLKVPPPVTLPEHIASERAKPQPRSSAELRDFILRNAHAVDGPSSHRRFVGRLHSPPSFSESSGDNSPGMGNTKSAPRPGVHGASVSDTNTYDNAVRRTHREKDEGGNEQGDRDRYDGKDNERGKETTYHRADSRSRHPRYTISTPASPVQFNSRGEIIGIAARRRAESIDYMSSPDKRTDRQLSPHGQVAVIRIGAHVPARPAEPFGQPPVPRSRSSSLAREWVKRRRDTDDMYGDNNNNDAKDTSYGPGNRAYDVRDLFLRHGKEGEGREMGRAREENEGRGNKNADAALLAATDEAAHDAATRTIPIAGPAAMQHQNAPYHDTSKHNNSNNCNKTYSSYSEDVYVSHAHAAHLPDTHTHTGQPVSRGGDNRSVGALQQLRPPPSRARSVSGMTAQGGPPLPRRGLVAPSPPPLVHYSSHGSSSSAVPSACHAAFATAHRPDAPLRAAVSAVSPVHTTVTADMTHAPARPPAPAHAAIPPSNFVPFTPSRQSMRNPLSSSHAHASMPGQHASRSVTPTTSTTTCPTAEAASAAHASKKPPSSRTLHPLTNTGGAFLALPRNATHKQQFLDDFLNGGWVRFYSFTNEDTVVMYYCLQPGRYGAMFPTEAGVGTAVLDIYSKLVMYVPCMNNESTSRSQPHPHVQTFYDEEARILTLAEAHRYLGDVLKCITAFVNETARLRSEGLTAAAVHAAFVHHRDTNAVPRDTKFVYIRKVFPDPGGTFTLFRLSNLRSQVVCNAMVDIRWQSDRRHNVGQKYYVHADGTAEPFVIDHTGILSQVEIVLNNSYRR